MANLALATMGVKARSQPLSINAQIAILLVVHVLLWTWVGISSRSNFDVPGDMVEAYVWGQGWQWGYFKHPPLSAWVTGLWFCVVPESQAGFSLLAAVNSGIGLLGLAVLAREFLPARWVLLCVAAASLTPGITTLGMRFNANAILISTWPWALAFFVRMMQRGRPLDAVLCGLACALAMLGKYYSGVLLLTLVFAALWQPHWRGRLRTATPWIAVAVFVMAIAPHLVWLLAQEQGPLQYAQKARLPQSRGDTLMRALHFALAQWVFPIVAFVVFWLSLTGPKRGQGLWQAITGFVRPRGDMVWLLAVLPVVATMLATVLTGARTASVWGLPIAAGVALLASQRAQRSGAELSLPRLWRALGVFWCVVALLSPLMWHVRARVQATAVIEPREELAQAVVEAWRAEYPGALASVTGSRTLAASVAFYAVDRPRYWSMWNAAVETPWFKAVDLVRLGGVIVCATTDSVCQSMGELRSAQRREIAVHKHVRGFQFPSHHYVLYLLPPAVRGIGLPRP